MGIRDLFRQRAESRTPTISQLIAYGTGRRVAGQPTGGLFNSALWSCVISLSRLYATLPWHAFRIGDGDSRSVEKGTLLCELMKRPNAYMTSYEFRFCMGFNFEMHGEAPAIIGRARNGLPIALWPVSPHSLVASEENGMLYYTLAANGQRYPAQDVLLIRNTPIGYGAGSVLDPIYFAKDDIELAEKCRQMQAEYYDGASVVGNNISVPQSFNKEQRDELRRMFNSARGFRNYILDERIKINPIQVQNADIATLTEAQKWSVQEVARRFGVPPFFVGDTTGTYNNSEQQGLQMVIYCLQPRIIAWEQALNSMLCGEDEYIKFSLDGLMRGDHATRAAFYHQGIMDGWLSINDVLRMEDMPGIGSDGDVHFFPLNYGTLPDIIAGKYASTNTGGSSPWSIWDIPDEDGKEKKKAPRPTTPAVERQEAFSMEEYKARLKAEKRRHDLLFVEEARRPAKTSRAKLEKLIREQLRAEIAEVRRLVATGSPAQTVVSDFKDWLETHAKEMSPQYKALYLDILKKMVPVVQAETGKDDEVSDASLEHRAGVYSDDMAGRVAGSLARTVQDNIEGDNLDAALDEFAADYPIQQSEEEVNRSSNAFAVFLFSQMHVSVFHVVAASDSCSFCSALDGKVSSVNGYVVRKGSDVATDDGEVRHINRDYRHPPFHGHCRCSVAPGE